MGEAVHLSHDERSQLIRTCRSTLDDCGLSNIPVVAGIGAASTRETIQLAHEAAEAGADFVMVIPPGYYAGALSAENKNSLKQFFLDVADTSRLPVILYNFVGVSDVESRLAESSTDDDVLHSRQFLEALTWTANSF